MAVLPEANREDIDPADIWMMWDGNPYMFDIEELALEFIYESLHDYWRDMKFD